MNANLIQSATRDVIARAIIATVLIAGILAIALATAHAEPAPGRIEHQHSVSLEHVRAAHIGAGRPAGCPRLWCGCYARMQVGIKDPRYNRALEWLRFRHVRKQVGAWAVMRRRGGGHVGRVVAIDPNGNPVLVSGNHGHRVGVGTYPAQRILAYVRP